MGFFGGKRERSQPAPRPRTAAVAKAAPLPKRGERSGASITVLLKGGTLNADQLIADCQRVTKGASVALGGMSLGGQSVALPPVVSENGSALSIVIGGVEITCMQINAQTPGLDQMIQFTRRANEELAPLKAHTSHVLCWATGKDGVEQTIALCQLAVAMKAQGAIGFIHVPAWQCFTLDQVETLLAPEYLDAIRTEMAKAVFCNLIPFHGQGGTWWATKGNHIFGIPDFALWNTGQMQPGEIHNLFVYLFDYIKKGAVLKHGETLNLPGFVLRVGPVTEYHDYIAGGGETFALRFV